MSAAGEIFVEALRYASTGEKLIFAIRACKLPGEMLVTLIKDDPGLAPELGAAADQLAAVVDSLQRAHTFAVARRDVRLQSIANNLEGGTPT